MPFIILFRLSNKNKINFSPLNALKAQNFSSLTEIVSNSEEIAWEYFRIIQIFRSIPVSGKKREKRKFMHFEISLMFSN